METKLNYSSLFFRGGLRVCQNTCCIGSLITHPENEGDWKNQFTLSTQARAQVHGAAKHSNVLSTKKICSAKISYQPKYHFILKQLTGVLLISATQKVVKKYLLLKQLWNWAHCQIHGVAYKRISMLSTNISLAKS